MTRRLTLAIFCLAVCAVPAAKADVITDWNAVLAETIRDTATTHGVHAGPGPVARAGAMTFGAMYDAVNSVDDTHEAYLLNVDVPATTSREAAAAVAAHRVLSSIYPDSLYPDEPQQARFDNQLATHLNAIPDGPDKTNGIAVGIAVADAMTAARTGDGSGIPATYSVNPDAGHWRPAFGQTPITPLWGDVTPFTLQSGSQFRSELPGGFSDMESLLASPEYAAQVDEVRQLGALFGSTRTADQTEIASFWANDNPGTYKPLGQLNYLNEVLASLQGNSLSENARMFALTNLALADASIAAWDTKYLTEIDLWRPRDAIWEVVDDGNALTTPDPTWQPLALQVNGSPAPAFPAYVSGHATFAAAQAAVLAEFFGTDDISFSLTSDTAPGVVRTFDSFSEAAIENGLSRLYLGVHYRWDSDAAFELGTNVGQYASANYLQPLSVSTVPEPASVGMAAIAVIGLGGVGIARRRRSRRLAAR